MRLIVPLLCCALVAGGCTTSVQVARVDPTDSRTRVGVPYSLPFTRYEISIDREVVACGNEIKIKTTAEIKSAMTRPDPDARFAIDPDSLSSPLKTSELKLEYDANGVATSLNATAEDRSAQVISNVVGSIAKVVSIAGIASRTEKAAIDVCSDDVITARTAIETQRPEVKAAALLVASRTEELKALQAKAVALGGNLDEQTKAQLSRAYDQLAEATERLSEKTGDLAKSVKVIRETLVVRWPDRGSEWTGVSEMPLSTLARWTNPQAVAATQGTIRKKFAAHFLLEPLSASGQSSGQQTIDTRLGIPVRNPEPGYLRICAGEPCHPGVEPIAEQVSDIPQLGMVYYLPCKSRPFSSIACNFTMSSDGMLKSMGSAQKAATAEGASGSALSALTTAEAVATDLSTAKKKKLEAATAELKAQADYEAALAAAATDPNADVKAETATAKANLELYQALKAEWDARVALEQVRATTGGTNP